MNEKVKSLLLIAMSFLKDHYLCTKSKACSITKSCTCIVENSSTVCA